MAADLSPHPIAGLGRAIVDRILYRQRTDASPFHLAQHRIYVLPTRRGWAFLATLLLMLLTAMNYSLSLGYGLTFLLFGLFCATLIHTFRNLARLQIEPSGDPRAFLGEPISYSFRVTNLSNLPRQQVVVLTGKSTGVIRDLAPLGSTTVSVSCDTERRGRRALGRFTVTTDFPLGIWRAWAVIRFDYSGLVYPRPEGSAPPLPLSGDAGMPLPEGTLAKLAADAEIDGLREYQRGDSPRAIAWKAVARGAGWYSKRLAGDETGFWASLRWSETPGTLDTESRLSRLTAWVLQANRRCIPFTMELPGHHVPLGQGPDHLDRALALLALHEGGATH